MALLKDIVKSLPVPNVALLLSLNINWLVDLSHQQRPSSPWRVTSPSKDAPPFASQAVKIKAKTLWLQYGIKSNSAKEIVKLANISYVENK